MRTSSDRATWKKARGLVVIGALLAGAVACDGAETTGPSAPTSIPTEPSPSTAPDAAVPAEPHVVRRVETAPTVAPPTWPEGPQVRLLDVAYGPDPAHRLDIHLPVESNGLAVLWLHAGGWTAGDRTGTGPVADQLVADGAVVFSADYRLTPDHVFPAQIHDVKRAIRWIKCHRADYPYRRLVVAGASAGGHLAALAATSAGAFEPADLPPQLAAHDSSVDGAVSLSGPMDLTRFWQADHMWARGLSDGFLDCDSAACDRDWMLEASPVHWVDPSDPPLYLAAGTADTLVTAADNADRMWGVVQAQGDPARCVYDRVDGGTHNLWDTLDPAGLRRFLARFDLALPAATASG